MQFTDEENREAMAKVNAKYRKALDMIGDPKPRTVSRLPPRIPFHYVEEA